MALVDNLEALLARGTDSALLRYGLGGEYLKLGQHDQAAAHLRQRSRTTKIFRRLEAPRPGTRRGGRTARLSRSTSKESR